MEVHMNFEIKTLSKRVGKFLEENIQDQEEKESVRKIMQGRKLQYPAANKLILTLIKAMVMGDGEEDEEDEFQDAGVEKGRMDKHNHKPKLRPQLQAKSLKTGLSPKKAKNQTSAKSVSSTRMGTANSVQIADWNTPNFARNLSNMDC